MGNTLECYLREYIEKAVDPKKILFLLTRSRKVGQCVEWQGGVKGSYGTSEYTDWRVSPKKAVG
jgi:hypothetical protein